MKRFQNQYEFCLLVSPGMTSGIDLVSLPSCEISAA